VKLLWEVLASRRWDPSGGSRFLGVGP
jgi:hypothetical protein